MGSNPILAAIYQRKYSLTPTGPAQRCPLPAHPLPRGKRWPSVAACGHEAATSPSDASQLASEVVRLGQSISSLRIAGLGLAAGAAGTAAPAGAALEGGGVLAGHPSAGPPPTTSSPKPARSWTASRPRRRPDPPCSPPLAISATAPAGSGSPPPRRGKIPRGRSGGG